MIPILGDASEEMEMLKGVADRVLMPLPEQAHAFLPSAVRALRVCKEGAEGGARGVIHYYDVSTGRKDADLFDIPFERAQNIIASAFGKLITDKTGRDEGCAFSCAAKISCGYGFACSVV